MKPIPQSPKHSTATRKRPVEPFFWVPARISQVRRFDTRKSGTAQTTFCPILNRFSYKTAGKQVSDLRKTIITDGDPTKYSCTGTYNLAGYMQTPNYAPHKRAVAFKRRFAGLPAISRTFSAARRQKTQIAILYQYALTSHDRLQS